MLYRSYIVPIVPIYSSYIVMLYSMELYSSILPNLFFFYLEINDLHKTSWILHLKPIGHCTYIYYNIITTIGSRHSANKISECFT